MNRGLVTYHLLKSPRLAPGSPGRDRLLTVLDDEARALVEGRVLPGSWYPERLTVSVMLGVVKALELNTNEEIRRYFVQQQRGAYSMAYRALLRMMPTRRLIERAPAFWKRQHTAGELTLTESSEGVALGRVDGNPYVVDPIYAVGVGAGMEALVSMTGARDASVEVVPVGAATITLEVRWST